MRNTDEIVHLVNEEETVGGKEGKTMDHQEDGHKKGGHDANPDNE